MLSIVVSTFDRFRQTMRLVESIEQAIPTEEYEIVMVSSDDPESEKVAWLKSRPHVVFIQADVRTDERLHSLYWYENLGIKKSQGDWIFVTNDDTRLHQDFYEEFLKVRESYDVILVKGHFGNLALGPRIPQIGELWKPGESKAPLYLYDFTLIRREIYKTLGYLDENYDWYGKGLDLALTIEFNSSARILHQSHIAVDHLMSMQHRNPPNPSRDFAYLNRKWNDWLESHPTYGYVRFEEEPIYLDTLETTEISSPSCEETQSSPSHEEHQ